MGMARSIMMKLRSWGILGFLLSASVGEAQKTDSVWIRNGDRLTGEVKSLSRALLKYSTDDFGTISIEWDKVVRIQSTATFEVQVNSGHKYYGNLGLASNGWVALGLDTLSLSDIVAITPIRQTFVARLDGYLDHGHALPSRVQQHPQLIGEPLAADGQKPRKEPRRVRPEPRLRIREAPARDRCHEPRGHRVAESRPQRHRHIEPSCAQHDAVRLTRGPAFRRQCTDSAHVLGKVLAIAVRAHHRLARRILEQPAKPRPQGRRLAPVVTMGENHRAKPARRCEQFRVRLP